MRILMQTAIALGAVGVLACTLHAAPQTQLTIEYAASDEGGAAVGGQLLIDLEPVDGSDACLHFAGSFEGPLSVVDGQSELGTIANVSLEVDFDPILGLGFTVFSGASPTRFTLSSPVVEVTDANGDPAFVSNALAHSSASLSTTPFGLSFVTGHFPGGKAYRAEYRDANGSWFTLADLIDSHPGPSGASLTDDIGHVNGLPVAPVSIPVDVYAIRTVFDFTVGAVTSVATTSQFTVEGDLVAIPEPAALTLLMLGGLIALRRR